jgi:hypothetical protein
MGGVNIRYDTAFDLDDDSIIHQSLLAVLWVARSWPRFESDNSASVHEYPLLIVDEIVPWFCYARVTAR